MLSNHLRTFLLESSRSCSSASDDGPWGFKTDKRIYLIDWLIDCFSWSSVLPSFSSALVKARLTHLAGSVIWHLTFTGCIAYYANGYQWYVGSPVNVCCSDRIPINLSMAITSRLPHSCSSISLISSRGSSGFLLLSVWGTSPSACPESPASPSLSGMWNKVHTW